MTGPTYLDLLQRIWQSRITAFRPLLKRFTSLFVSYVDTNPWMRTRLSNTTHQRSASFLKLKRSKYKNPRHCNHHCEWSQLAEHLSSASGGNCSISNVGAWQGKMSNLTISGFVQDLPLKCSSDCASSRWCFPWCFSCFMFSFEQSTSPWVGSGLQNLLFGIFYVYAVRNQVSISAGSPPTSRWCWLCWFGYSIHR